MKKVLKIIGWILLILLLALAIAWFGFLKPEPPPISPEDRAEIKLMPLPSQLKLGKGVFVLDEDISHAFTSLTTPRMERAVERFYKKLSDHTSLNVGNGNGRTLILECTGSEMGYPSLEDDESYSMKISGSKIEVIAPSETGIIYALETLLQLIRKEEGRWILPQLKLDDQPRYAWLLKS
jgi:hexosaminidase